LNPITYYLTLFVKLTTHHQEASKVCQTKKA